MYLQVLYKVVCKWPDTSVWMFRVFCISDSERNRVMCQCDCGY